jgi:hypothetical protein
MEAIVSPDAFKHVAIGSSKNPKVATIGKASAGNPNKLAISISPTSPPPGALDNTKALRIDTTKAIRYVSIPANGKSNIPNKKLIFNIYEITEPSICIAAPIGNTISYTDLDPVK